MQKFYERIISFFFPMVCIHCNEFLCEGRKFFCSGCEEHFVLRDPLVTSRHLFPYIEKYTSCFERMGPAASLEQRLKKDFLFAQMDIFSSLLIVQLDEARMLEVDAVIGLFHKEDKALAKKLAKNLHIDYLNNLDNEKIVSKKVLLVAYYCQDEKEFVDRAKQLFLGFPKAIYAIAFIAP